MTFRKNYHKTSHAACGSKAEKKTDSVSANEAKSTETDYTEVSIAVILAGSISDNGWNAADYNAFKEIADKYGCMFAYTENASESEVEEFVAGCGD